MEEQNNELPKIEAKKSNPWIAVCIALLIITATLGYIQLNPKQDASIITKEQALADTVAYINTNLLPQNITAAPVGVEEISYVYKISIEVNNQTFNSFVSKDGRYLFTQGIDMKQPMPTTEIAQSPQVVEQPSEADVSEPQPSGAGPI